MRHPIVSLALVATAAALPSRPAGAQEERTYAEEPTGGLHLPTAGIAGTQDALTTVTNPAGVLLLDGFHFGVALDLGRDSVETTGGAGAGVFLASVIENQIFKLGLGLGLEFLRPPRVVLEPDPGRPTRFTQSTAIGFGKSGALGLAWHRFFAEHGHPLDGLNTFDLGYTTRVGSRWAAGAVIRDLFSPAVGGVPVQRRYELELVSRPDRTDRLELGIGGRVGETRGDLDGWVRGSFRLARGVYLRAEVASLELLELTRTASGEVTERDRRELRASAGLEVSFGSLGVAAYGTGARLGGESRARGGTFVARVSDREVRSVIPAGKRIERVELKGAMGPEAVTRTVAYLRNIARDDAVVAVLLQLDSPGAGWASINEIRRELLRVKGSGKKVFAYLVAGTTSSYYLASVADRIYVDPAGGIRLQGFSGTALYFKGLFDNLGIEAQFEQIEEFKSAPEAYTLTGPTEPARMVRDEIYDGMYAELVRGIAEGRGIDEARVKTLIDNGPYTSGDLERQPDLVDGVILADEVGDRIASELGRRYPYGRRPSLRPERWRYPGVAVIFISGDIVDGQSRTIPLLGRRLVGAETIAQAIRTARADRNVAAIILRIESPGGSALASELMAREVFKTRGKKPIICSLGNVAASGGYFAAAGCDKIFADPMTITGSIGIFNGKFDLSQLLGRIGLSWSTYRRGERADVESYFRPFTDEERELMKSKLHYYYGRFIKAVSEGRDISVDQVDDVGRGRVWTGTQARSIDLVDELGGIGDAIAEAKERAGLRDDDLVQLTFLPRQEQTLLSRLLGGGLPFGAEGVTPGEEAVPSGEADATGDQADPVRALLRGILPGGAAGALWDAIPGSVWEAPGVPQTRLPFELIWTE